MFGFSQPKVPQIDATEVKKALDEHKDMTILDVRTQGEYSRGKIPNSLNIPLNELADTVSAIIPDKSRTVYVYCMSGSRSAAAVDELLKMGYANAMDIKSGLLSWRANGFSISQ
ncbi:MAG: rhodanese-like domain-containing protein [Candidatus Levybacteria bacterium]|nr:rhodanese-like domain-containing protein [Candidatus Levybacteria bacterium]